MSRGRFLESLVGAYSRVLLGGLLRVLAGGPQQYGSPCENLFPAEINHLNFSILNKIKDSTIFISNVKKYCPNEKLQFLRLRYAKDLTRYTR